MVAQAGPQPGAGAQDCRKPREATSSTRSGAAAQGAGVYADVDVVHQGLCADAVTARDEDAIIVFRLDEAFADPQAVVTALFRQGHAGADAAEEEAAIACNLNGCKADTG